MVSNAFEVREKKFVNCIYFTMNFINFKKILHILFLIKKTPFASSGKSVFDKSHFVFHPYVGE